VRPRFEIVVISTRLDTLPHELHRERQGLFR
jgi:hypothetical protein